MIMAQKYTRNDVEPIFKYRINAMLDDGAISVKVADYIQDNPTLQTAIVAQLVDTLNSGKLDNATRPLNDQATWVQAIRKVFRIYRAPALKGGTHHVKLDFA